MTKSAGEVAWLFLSELEVDASVGVGSRVGMFWGEEHFISGGGLVLRFGSVAH